MPDVRPFRGWRYAPRLAGPLDHLICPPYDVISPTQAQQLLERNPHNVIHLELGSGPTDPNIPDNRYDRAASTLRQWIADGTLQQEQTPALYVYEQRFSLDGQARRRLAVFAAVQLSPWEAGDVLPHEVTLSAPKRDRLALLEATQTNISPIYALCDGGLPGVGALLAVAGREQPVAEARDDAGEEHRLWVVSAVDLIDGVQRELSRRPLYIADGHHRYETALAYAQAHPDDRGPEGAGYVLMAITPVDDPGLVVLPTHRLLRDLEPERVERALAGLNEAFEVTPVEDSPSAEHLRRVLRGSSSGHGIVVYARDGVYLLRPRLDGPVAANRLSGLPQAMRALDVAVVQALLFEKLLGLTPEDIQRQTYIDYTRDAAEALRLVDEGRYQLAVLLNPTPPEAILAVARAGAQMPQKSTYFYPKLATGMVLRRLS